MRIAKVAVTIGLLALAGCGAEDGGATAEQPSSPAASRSASPAPTITQSAARRSPVPEVLRFTGTTLDGKPFDGTTLAGKPTVLWFWAPWCPKCRAQASETAKVAADYRGRVNFVGVAGLDKTPKMRDFVEDNEVSGFPHLTDEAGTVWQRFEVAEQSTYVLLDAKGGTVHRGVFPNGEGLSDKVATLAG
jgi:thiol-disulfide isomerase/thioredoxin